MDQSEETKTSHGKRWPVSLCSHTLCRSRGCRADSAADPPVAGRSRRCTADTLQEIDTARGQDSRHTGGCLRAERDSSDLDEPRLLLSDHGDSLLSYWDPGMQASHVDVLNVKQPDVVLLGLTEVRVVAVPFSMSVVLTNAGASVV